MDPTISPDWSKQRPRTSHVHTLSAALPSSHHRTPSTSLRRRPSLSAVAALFTPSSSNNTHNSWRDVPQSTPLNRPGTSACTPSEDTRGRTRRPSVTMATLSRNLFGTKLREEEIPNEGRGWFRRLTDTFKKERTASSSNHDQDTMYSLSSSAPADWTRHYHGGAAARAAAAAQNKVSSSSLRREFSRLRKPQNDSESGIGIDLNFDSEDATMVRIDPAAALPVEMFSHCLSFLDAVSLTDAELVSKKWHYISSSRSMWRTLFNSEFGSSSDASGLGNLTPNQEWKKMWRARKALQQRWTDGHAAAIYLEGHKDTVYCVQFDEEKIITGSRDRTLRVWDMKTYECLRVIGTPRVGHARWIEPLVRPTRGCLPFQTLIPTQSSSIEDSNVLDSSLTHQGSILCLQFDQEILVTGSSDTTLVVWSIQDYSPIRRLQKHTAGVLDVCFDRKIIVSCSKDTTICIWDRETGDLIRQLSGHRGPVNAVQLRGELIVSASGDGIAKLWNITSGLCVKEFSSRDRGLACVEFSPDCRYIYAGGNDQSIYQFDSGTRELVRELKGHRGLVRSLHLDQANHRIVSGSYDHSIQVYDTSTGEMVCEFAGWTTSWMLSAKVDYRRIVATSQDRRVVVVDFGLGVSDVDLLRR